MILRESHVSSLIWLSLSVSPPQGCDVCSWSRETSVILTEPWQMPHSNKQHPFNTHTAAAAMSLHPGSDTAPSFTCLSSYWGCLPAAPTLQVQDQGTSVCRDAQQTWARGFAPRRCEEGSHCRNAGCKHLLGSEHISAFQVGTSLGWLILSIMGKTHRTPPPLGYEWVFLEEAPHLAPVTFRSESLRKWCGHVLKMGLTFSIKGERRMGSSYSKRGEA